MADSRNVLSQVFGSRAAKLACVASLGLALAGFGMSAPQAFAAPSALDIASSSQSQAAEQQNTIIGEWELEEMQLPGAQSGPINPEDMGVDISLIVLEDGTVSLNADTEGMQQSIPGAWQETEQGYTFDFGENGVYDVTFDANGQLICSNADEYLVFEKESDDSEPEQTTQTTVNTTENQTEDAVVASDSFVGFWMLKDINLSQNGLIESSLGFDLGESALNLALQLGVFSHASISQDDSNAYSLSFEGPFGLSYTYKGEWEPSGSSGIRFTDSNGNLIYTVRGTLSGDQLTVRYVNSSIPLPVEFVFERSEQPQNLGQNPVQDLLGDFNLNSAYAVFPMTAGTGYEWTCEIADESVCEVDEDEVTDLSQAEGITGGTGAHYFMIVPKAEGTTRVTFTYARSWEQTDSDIICTYTVTVDPNGVLTISDYEGPEEYAMSFMSLGDFMESAGMSAEDLLSASGISLDNLSLDGIMESANEALENLSQSAGK